MKRVIQQSAWLAVAATVVLAVFAGENRRAPVTHAAESPVTFNRQIAPILYKNCATCHHPGGAGPFSLLTYADARRWAPQIVRVTQNRFMPPWLPEPGYGDFADQRRLTEEQIAMLREWARSGMPEGNPADAPPVPRYSSDWVLGTPDLILTAPKPFRTPASGSDVFRNFILPYPLQQTHYIRAMEILPGAPRVVHHANILIDRTASLRRAHPQDWRDGIAGMELMVDSGNTFDPDSHFLFWKPDTPALVEPPGMPWRLDPGNDLILNMHLKPTGKPETVQARIGLYFTEEPPTQHPILLELEHDSALNIPPGDANFVVQDQLTLPIDLQVLGVYPHAHYLGKDLQGYAILPNGHKQWLIWIRDWDIDRQSVYRYRHPLYLPKGTTLHMRYTYDNSAANIRNPNSPPIRVRAGNRSVDEMGHLWLQVLPVNPPKTLAAQGSSPAKDPRLLLEHAWMEARLQKDAQDPIALYNMAAIDLAEGDYDQSIAIDRKLLAGNPTDARTLTALGAALESKGDWRQAQQQYQRAMSLDPDGTEARFDLARLDLAHGAYPDAASAFRTLLLHNPNDADAHSGLGVALLNQGNSSEAQAEFEQALAIDPRNFTALDNLGQMEIAEGQLPRAIQLLQSAVASRNDADARQHLALAYANSGRMADAADQLRQALDLQPRSALTHGLLSRVYSSMGEWQQALEERQRSLQLQPEDSDGWNDLGVIEIHLNASGLARKDFLRALQIDPANALARANLNRLNSQSRIN